MEKEKKKKRIIIGWKVIKKVLYLIIVGVMILLIASKCSRNRITFESASNLIKNDEIEKFNLARYKWDGIAEYYKGDDKENVDTYIKYEAEIIATMNMDNFSEKNVIIDQEQKKIYVTLPKIELKPNIVFKDDGSSFSFIPKKNKLELRDIIATCEDDAIKKVTERIDMFNLAKKNAQTTIEGLLLPLIEEENYIIIWKDGE